MGRSKIQLNLISVLGPLALRICFRSASFLQQEKKGEQRVSG